MKRDLIGLGVIFVLSVVCILSVFSYRSYMRNRYYPTATVVYKVDNDLITVRDANGHLWSFYSDDNFIVGDVCAMIMDSMNTDRITDDQIVEVRYNGSLDY